MSKCKTKVNYRKIYEQHYGPIPHDNQGRSFEIHHIDGNRNNNDISNLRAVSLEDHYNIHKMQGDWAACLLIAAKLKLSGEQIREIARNNNLKQLADGIHPFQSEKVKAMSRQRVINGTHNWLDSKTQRETAKKRLAHSTHEQRSEAAKKRQKALVEKGTHQFLGGNIGRAANFTRLSNGTHNLLGPGLNKKRMDEGTHNILIRHTCPYCNRTANGPNYSRWHGDKCREKPTN